MYSLRAARVTRHGEAVDASGSQNQTAVPLAYRRVTYVPQLQLDEEDDTRAAAAAVQAESSLPRNGTAAQIGVALVRVELDAPARGGRAQALVSGRGQCAKSRATPHALDRQQRTSLPGAADGLSPVPDVDLASSRRS